jgi:hypothetical protein
MKEYIERAVVKEKILSWAVCINHPELLSKEDTMHCINSLPAADVAEVRHGRWIENTFCSCCGGFDEDDKGNIIQSFYNYCPNCGARMDKEDEHEAD